MWYFKSVLVYILIFSIIFYIKRDWVNSLIEQVKRENNLIYVDEQEMWWSVVGFAILISLIPVIRLLLIIGLLNVE